MGNKELPKLTPEQDYIIFKKAREIAKVVLEQEKVTERWGPFTRHREYEKVAEKWGSVKSSSGQREYEKFTEQWGPFKFTRQREYETVARKWSHLQPPTPHPQDEYEKVAKKWSHLQPSDPHDEYEKVAEKLSLLTPPTSPLEYEKAAEKWSQFKSFTPQENDVVISRLSQKQVTKINNQKRYCEFCFNNARFRAENEGRKIAPQQDGPWREHRCKNGKGEVVCPVLSSHHCERCGATGTEAHTLRYCPLPDNRPVDDVHHYVYDARQMYDFRDRIFG